MSQENQKSSINNQTNINDESNSNKITTDTNNEEQTESKFPLDNNKNTSTNEPVKHTNSPVDDNKNNNDDVQNGENNSNQNCENSNQTKPGFLSIKLIKNKKKSSTNHKSKKANVKSTKSTDLKIQFQQNPKPFQGLNIGIRPKSQPQIINQVESAQMSEFKNKLKYNVYDVFGFNPKNYGFYKHESSLIVLEKKLKTQTRFSSSAGIPQNKKSPKSRQAKNEKSDNNDNDDSGYNDNDDASLFKTSPPKSNEHETDNEKNDKYRDLKRLFLRHRYEKQPTRFDHKYFADQMNHYSKEKDTFLTRIQGIEIEEKDNDIFPTVLTERPVNGPLSSLFKTVSGEQIDSDTFNLDQIKTVSQEQKFSLVCGIAFGLHKIHFQGFIHSNLSPGTIYVNDKLQACLCDYISAQPFKVTTEIIDGKPKRIFQYEDRPEENPMSVYSSPELKNCETFDTSTDIYSLGLVIYFILTEQEPTFSDAGELKFPGELNKEEKKEWLDLINLCICTDKTKRPSALQILQEHLLNKDKRDKYLETILTANSESRTKEMNQEAAKILQLITETVIGNKQNKPFRIFGSMIPNLIELDDEIRYKISIAEKGDPERIKEVGDLFYSGKGNLLQDEEWAFHCYEESADRGNVESMLIVSKFSEEGIGTEVNLCIAHKYYNKAKENMEKTNDSRLEEITNKVDKLWEQLTTVTLKVDTKSISIDKIIENSDDLKPSIKSNTAIENDKNFDTKIVLEFADQKNAADAIIRYKYVDHCEVEDLTSMKEKVSHRFDSLTKFVPLIKLEDYEPVLENGKYVELGQGFYATAYLVQHKETKEKYVAKVFKEELRQIEVNSFKRELLMSSKFHHKCLLHYIGFNPRSIKEYFDNVKSKKIKPTILMSYMENGNLEKKFPIREKAEDRKKESQISDTSKIKIIIGIASGIRQMHSQNIIHRDLKPSNILLNKNDEAVIGDFGCARQFFTNKDNRMTTKVGTFIYEAPETFVSELNYSYTYEVDTYAFGIIMYQILTDTSVNNIYSDHNCTVELNEYRIQIKKFEGYIPYLGDLHPVFEELIGSCWNKHLNERPDAETIVQTLIEAVDESIENKKPLLPNADMNAIKDYISTLNESPQQ